VYQNPLIQRLSNSWNDGPASGALVILCQRKNYWE